MRTTTTNYGNACHNIHLLPNLCASEKERDRSRSMWQCQGIFLFFLASLAVKLEFSLFLIHKTLRFTTTNKFLIRKHKMRMELGHDKLSSNWPHTTRHQGERKNISLAAEWWQSLVKV